MNQFVLLICLLAGSVALAKPKAASVEKGSVRKIRWFMAHNPGNEPVVTLIKSHVKKIEKKSGGKLKIELVYEKAPEENLHSIGTDAILDGKADLSQITVSKLSSISFPLAVFDMPFLFRSYDHAGRVLEGPIAQQLLAGIYNDSEKKIRGFAFTYSGGYRIFFGDVAIRDVSDFKKVKMWKHGGKVRTDYLAQLGVEFTPSERTDRGEQAKAFVAKEINADEGELNRMAIFRRQFPETVEHTKYATLTHHNMYITMLVANEKFFASLSKSQQDLLSEELQVLAQEERALSIKLEIENKKLLAKQGVEFIEFSPENIDKMKTAGNTIHQKYKDQLGSLVSSIRAVDEATKVSKE